MGDPAWGVGSEGRGALEKRVGEKCGRIKGRGRRGGREKPTLIGGFLGKYQFEVCHLEHLGWIRHLKGMFTQQERFHFATVLEPQPNPKSNGAAIFKNPNMVSKPSRILNPEIKSAPEF